MGRIHFGPPHFFYKNVIKLQSMAVRPEKVSGIQNPLDKDFFLPESYAFTMVSFQEEWETCSSQSKAELKLNCWLIDWLRERGHILQWEILKLGRIFRPWSCCQGRLTDLLNLFKESGWSLWEDRSGILYHFPKMKSNSAQFSFTSTPFWAVFNFQNLCRKISKITCSSLKLTGSLRKRQGPTSVTKYSLMY